MGGAYDSRVLPAFCTPVEFSVEVTPLGAPFVVVWKYGYVPGPSHSASRSISQHEVDPTRYFAHKSLIIGVGGLNRVISGIRNAD